MIDIMTKIHDKFSIEFKVGFLTRRKMRHNDFSVYMWIFVPNALDINSTTYSKADFYRDVKSNVRLITPRFLLRNIVDGEAIPAQKMREAMEQMASYPTRTSRAEYESQIKIFAAIVKSALREESNHICNSQQSVEDIRFLCGEYVKNASRILEVYRQMHHIINTPTVTAELMNCFHYGDEFMSYMLNQYTFRLMRHLSQSGDIYEKEIAALATLVRDEQHYRVKMGYLSVSNSYGQDIIAEIEENRVLTDDLMERIERIVTAFEE